MPQRNAWITFKTERNVERGVGFVERAELRLCEREIHPRRRCEPRLVLGASSFDDGVEQSSGVGVATGFDRVPSGHVEIAEAGVDSGKHSVPVSDRFIVAVLHREYARALPENFGSF